MPLKEWNYFNKAVQDDEKHHGDAKEESSFWKNAYTRK